MSYNVRLLRSPDAAEPAAAEEAPAPTRSWGYVSGDEVVIEEAGEEEPEEQAPEGIAPEAAAAAAATAAEGSEPEETKAPASTPAPAAKPSEVTAPDWKAAIKTADKWEALKELGYDDFTIGMLRYKEQTGDFTPYLQVKTVDYTKMTEEQLFKADMQRKHPGLSERAINFKLNKELGDKYFLDRDNYPEESDEAEIGQELLKADAEALRKQFIDEQAKFKAPEPKPEPGAAELQAANKERQQKQQGVVINSPVTKALQNTKTLTFGKGEESFKFPIANVDGLVSQALQTVQSSDAMNFDDAQITNFYKLLAIGADVEGFETTLAEHYKKVGKKLMQKEISNVTPLNNNGAGRTENNLTPAQQLARNGVLK